LTRTAQAIARILVVDDDSELRALLAEMLRKHGVDVDTAEDGDIALTRIAADPPTAVVLDVKMPRTNGLDVLLDIKRLYPEVPVVILTAHGDVAMAVEAMRRGAADYLGKPFRQQDLLMSIERAVERRGLLTRSGAARSAAPTPHKLVEQMGPSRQVQEVARQVESVARSALTVLIQGETGTGKELVARAVHEVSGRGSEVFVALDCGAVPETLMESELFGHIKGAFTGAERAKDGHFRRAHRGTLLLDEISNLPTATQGKLLRVLQEREVLPLGAGAPVAIDVRFVAASNLLLKEEMLAGRFRQDLYYRLSEFTIVLPALRERCEDIPYLAERFLTQARTELDLPVRGISEDALQLLVVYPWPGNVRELRNVIRRAAVISRDVIRPEHLSMSGVASTPPRRAPSGRSLREHAEAAAVAAEQEAIRQALRATRGNKSEAARLLKTEYKTLHLKMRRYGITADDFRRS
jgi:two-component system nitrogen regulation response regulator GlnG